VLGELAIGVLLGNLRFIGLGGFDDFKTDPMVDMVARLGVIILLFAVGLESTVGQMLAVGLSSLLVATVGVIAPFALGWGVGVLLLPEASVYVHAFLGATLTATSVGITARVLQDLGKTNTPEARIILGAAVIDDVMGLVILAVVGGAIAAAASGQALSYGSLFVILAKAVLFLVGALAVGVRFSPFMFRFASRLESRGVLLALALSWCFLLSWLASAIELAPIVGAFAAGLVLERVHYRDFVDRGEHELEELVAPITAFLVPVFFVVMGMRTDLASFADTRVLGLAAALTVAAVIGKQACGLGVIGGGVDRITVGLGMIPRGEVGLIFANMGMALVLAGTPIVTPPLYSAIVVMVIVTTLVTPPALKWSLGRQARLGGPLTGPPDVDL
jgi:Kef-type K+ transport system membrane component KefB